MVPLLIAMSPMSYSKTLYSCLQDRFSTIREYRAWIALFFTREKALKNYLRLVGDSNPDPPSDSRIYLLFIRHQTLLRSGPEGIRTLLFVLRDRQTPTPSRPQDHNYTLIGTQDKVYKTPPVCSMSGSNWLYSNLEGWSTTSYAYTAWLGLSPAVTLHCFAHELSFKLAPRTGQRDPYSL